MIIDLIFIVVMLIALIKGYSRGFIVALFSILGLVIGVAAALKLSALVASRLSDHISVSARWLPFIAFAVVFILVVLLVRLGARLVEKTFQLAMMGWLNRLGGIVLFMLLYTVLFSIVLFYATQIHLINPGTVASSVTYAYIEPWGPKLMDGFGQLLPVFKNMFHDLESFFDRVAKNAG